MLIFTLQVIINFRVAGTILAGCLQWLPGKTKQMLGRYWRKAPRVLPPCFPLLVQVEIFMHREGNKGMHPDSFLAVSLESTAFWTVLKAWDSWELVQIYTQCHYLPVASFWQSFGRWNHILSEHQYQLRSLFVFGHCRSCAWCTHSLHTV